MKKLPLVLAVAISAAFATPTLATETVPCEKMLEDLRTNIATSKLSEADMAKVNELQDKGIERCNADDDTHADEFFTQAMTLLGK
jgi:hypothetical protein